MARYNKVKIANMHLTSDGTDAGLPCAVNVEGIVKNRPQFRRSYKLPIEGPAKFQLFDNLIGEQIILNIANLATARFEDLIAIIDAADAGDGEINITLEGETGDLDLQCEFEDIDQPGEMRTGFIPNVRVIFRIKSVNPIEEEE